MLTLTAWAELVGFFLSLNVFLERARRISTNFVNSGCRLIAVRMCNLAVKTATRFWCRFHVWKNFDLFSCYRIEVDAFFDVLDVNRTPGATVIADFAVITEDEIFFVASM